MVNQELLNDTLQKINASLNKRFEKDADLYISRQDENDLKKHLCNGAYAAVADMAKAKGISHDIVVKVLLRNAGVITVTDFTRFKEELRPVLRDADYNILEYMMEDVFTNNVYMQRKLRHILFYYYMSGISTEKRLRYWDDGRLLFDAHERDQLYGLILEKAEKDGPLGPLDARIEFMNQAFIRFPSIMKDKKAMLKLAVPLDEGEKARFFKYLRGEIERPSIQGEVYAFALVNAYCSYRETAFQDAVGQIKSGSPPQFKEYIKAIRKLFEQEQDPDALESMFDLLYKVYCAPYMQRHIQQRLSRKVWPLLKNKPGLYERRRAQIDRLLSEIEETEQKRYESFADIRKDMLEGVYGKEKGIAFAWLNMPRDTFVSSLEESFTGLDGVDTGSVRAVYSWLFQHSMRKGGTKELAKLCGWVARALSRFSKTGQSSEFFALLDGFWVGYVVQYKLKGKDTEDYMFEAHYDQVKKWQQ